MLRTIARRDSGLYYTKPKIGYNFNPTSTTALYLPLWHPGLLNYGILVNGTGLADNAPVNLVVGDNTITASQAGTFTVHLQKGYTGTVTSGTAVITGSPVSITGGGQTVTAEGAGTFTVNLGNVIVSRDLNEHLATVTGATKGVLGYSYDGDDYITIPTAASLQIQNNLTNSVWFRTPATFNTNATAFAGIETLPSRWTATANQRSWTYGLANVEDGGNIDNFIIYISQDGTNTGTYYGYYATNLVANTWYRATFTFASGVVTAYLNGSVIALTETNSPPATLFNSTADILLSGINGGATNPWKSIIGQEEMYNRVVSAGREMNNYLATRWRW